jgi:hypothetical protein
MQPVGSGPDARTYTVTADSTHRAALHAEMVREWSRRSRTWWRPVLSGTLIGLGLVLSGVQVVPAVLVGAALCLALGAFSYVRYVRAVEAALARGWYDGSVHTTTFDAEGMVSRGPLGGVEYRWATVRQVVSDRGVVTLALEPRGVRMMVPLALFPIEEVTAARRLLPSPPPT